MAAGCNSLCVSGCKQVLSCYYDTGGCIPAHTHTPHTFDRRSTAVNTVATTEHNTCSNAMVPSNTQRRLQTPFPAYRVLFWPLRVLLALGCVLVRDDIAQHCVQEVFTGYSRGDLSREQGSEEGKGMMM